MQIKIVGVITEARQGALREDGKPSTTYLRIQDVEEGSEWSYGTTELSASQVQPYLASRVTVVGRLRSFTYTKDGRTNTITELTNVSVVPSPVAAPTSPLGVALAAPAAKT